MILRHLRVENFGRLGNGEWTFGPGMNVVKGPNEAGKSTLAEAVHRVLLGPPVSTSSTDAQRWRTWGRQEMYRLEAEFEHGGQRWRVVRDYGASEAVLENLGTGERVRDDAKVREMLAGMVGLQPRAAQQREASQQYLATGYLRQGEWASVREAVGVTDLIGQALSAGRRAPQKVIGELKRRHEEYRRGMDRAAPKNPGRVAQARARRDELTLDIEGDGKDEGQKARAAKEEAARQQLLEAREQLEKTQAELGGERPRLEAARKRRELEVEMAGVQAKARETSKTVAKVQELQGKVDDRQRKADARQAIAGEDVGRVAKDLDQVRSLRESAARATEEAKGKDAEAAQIAARADEAMKKAPSETAIGAAEELEGELNEAAKRAADLEMRVRIEGEEYRRLRAKATLWAVGAAGAAVVAIAGMVLNWPLPGWGFGVLWFVAIGLAILGALSHIESGKLPPPKQLTEEHNAARQALDDIQRRFKAALGPYGTATVSQFAQVRTRAIEAAAKLRGDAENLAGKAEALRDEAMTDTAKSNNLEASAEGQLMAWGMKDLAAARAYVAEGEQLVKDAESARNELKGVLGGKTIETLAAELVTLQTELGRITRELERPEMQAVAMSEAEFGELQQRVAALEERQRDLALRAAEARGTLDSNQGAGMKLLALEGETEAVEAAVRAAEHQERVLGLTVELLERATEEARASAHEEVLPVAEKIVARLTAGRYEKLKMGTNMEAGVVAAEKGGVAGDEELSYATREQVYLAVRLAMCMALWPEEGPPIMLDEPLLAFDEARKAAALEVLRGLAERRQVLVLTCSGDYDGIADGVVELGAGA